MMTSEETLDHKLPAFAELMRRPAISGGAHVPTLLPVNFNPHENHNGHHQRAFSYEDKVASPDVAMDLCARDLSSASSRSRRLKPRTPSPTPAERTPVTQERLEQDHLGDVPELVAAGRRLIFQDVSVLVTRLDGVDILTGMKTSFFKCHVCGKACSNLRRLQKHLGLHCERRVAYRRRCPVCHAGFKFKVHLFRHLRTVHRVSPQNVLMNDSQIESQRRATASSSKSTPADRHFTSTSTSAATSGSFINRVHSVIENAISEEHKKAKSSDYTGNYVNDISDVSADEEETPAETERARGGVISHNEAAYKNFDRSQLTRNPAVTQQSHLIHPHQPDYSSDNVGYLPKLESHSTAYNTGKHHHAPMHAGKDEVSEGEETESKLPQQHHPAVNSSISPPSVPFTSMMGAMLSPSSSITSTTPLLTQSGFMAGLPTIPLLSPPLSGMPNPLQIMPLMPMLNQGHLLNNPSAIGFMQQQAANSATPGTSSEANNEAQPADQSRAMSIVAYNQEVLRNRARVALMKTLARRRSRKVCRPTTLPDGTQVFRCFHCHKDYNSLTDLNRHLIVHGDSRPYKCRLCDYYARAHSQLKVHMMRHQGIREYHCKICNYKGVTQSDLNRHYKSKVHMLKAQFPCFQCDEGFTSPKFRDLHILQHHLDPKMDRKETDGQRGFESAAAMVKEEVDDGDDDDEEVAGVSMDLSRPTVQPVSAAVFPGQDRDLHDDPEHT